MIASITPGELFDYVFAAGVAILLVIFLYKLFLADD